ncbi:hypothetical protein TRIP_E160200 [uncultured Spirochaetota bacterium]|uniref:Uncharacterized protein n=1 Tax=uncultured Spirochaetota bacterium TaxID=460511 RepID=A0A652ZT94_9SPIR|nr:hypothetical protein TRIP_E160200 [uncultured Spirochaetota bacterium]
MNKYCYITSILLEYLNSRLKYKFEDIISRKNLLSIDEICNHNEETKKAYGKLISWINCHFDKIEALCIYGSSITDGISDKSINLRKSEGQYRDDVIEIGSSDIDAIIITNEKVVFDESCISMYRVYNTFAEEIELVKKNILENVFVVSVTDLDNLLIFDTTLSAMYYRMLVKQGYWIYDKNRYMEYIKNKIECEYQNNINEIETNAKEFYFRRINAICKYNNQLQENRINEGYMYSDYL